MFDPTSETWSVVRNDAGDPGLRTSLGITINNVFHMVGGRDSGGTTSNEVRAYDPDTNAWTLVGNLPVGVEDALGVLYNS